MKPRLAGVVFFLIVPFLGLLHPGGLQAAGKGPMAGPEETMLMFVGEDLGILSIASRREESAWRAPAVASSLSRKEIRERGVTTLSQALEMVPGFYMAQKEGGSTPYLRGIPNSVLFLHDTVPLGSDLSKSIHPLDHDLSLASVKRIEIVRGPGSVLWGADAFAGIVNVVPMSGRDLDGIETGVLYGSPGAQKGLFANMGHDGGAWDAFFSVSGRKGREDESRIHVVEFWDDGGGPVPVEERYGDKKPGWSEYVEAVGRLDLEDWLSVTGRLSTSRRDYGIADSEGAFRWEEEENIPSGHLKIEAKKTLDPVSALRFTGSFSRIHPRYTVIDLPLDQDERTWYGECIYDRSFHAGKGLLTGGISYRKKKIEEAPLWDGYLPDFLGPENESFLPGITKVDYDASLFSIFGQYTHNIGDFSLFLGLRYDDHDLYEDNISYNLGTVWTPYREWVFKILYGSAYRTPSSRQLMDENRPELENIECLSAEISWRPSTTWGASLVGFLSRIDNHIMEDPYAGLSEPNSQSIKGVEIEGHFAPVKSLTFRGNLTLLTNNGPQEIYYYNDYTFVRPDGTVVKHYTDKLYPYDAGPLQLANIMASWQVTDRISTFFRAGYHASTRLIYPRGEDFKEIKGGWLLDMGLGFRNAGLKGLDIDVSVKNLVDRDYLLPGTYSAIEGRGRSFEVTLSKRW